MVQATQFRGSASGKAIQTSAELPDIKPDEVLLKVTDSGLCGSDLHFLNLSLVLGHEGVGIVEQIGSACSRLKVGDRVGWGLVNSTCDTCDMCISGRDAYCHNIKMYGTEGFDTQGSICSHAVRKEQWLFKVPDSMPSADAAPLMCGGGTVWVPLVEQCKTYERVGIVGIGGLGHLAIQFAAKMGCDVVVFSSTEDKRDEALKLGANEFYATKGVSDYANLGVAKPIDRLLITSSAKFNLGLFYPVLARNASIIPLSVDSGDLTAPYMPTVVNGNSIVGSCISSRYPQNKMIDFAARHKIHSIVERYPMTLEGVTQALDRLQSGKMRYRGLISWN
ncbi:NADP-dependent alcohol dehydrogenase [Aspergillus sclerotiicarbonarius CBS 121057]|uniref:NADP-dependent alcohol dehydrogenase n=1 Tax=Aspergillus sclerotiicarbonarius (strain CBS 121057 / IBT 28362) TaxID=1448318 RepID=A0A319ERB9_ASPSB|nr:NADP-dependent alcohol dehydrogenase [Aspergillus sclerotiicarbonarius CBS 121057]